MKTVYYIRHAKSSWAELHQKDILRPLNHRGNTDAPAMAAELAKMMGKKSAYSDTAILSSPSVRTKQTLQYFQQEFSIDGSAVFIDEMLYHPDPSQLEESLFQLDEKFDSVLVFSHNPAITIFANEFGSEIISNVPTCGIYRVDYQATAWTDVAVQQSKMIFFIYPKMFK